MLPLPIDSPDYEDILDRAAVLREVERGLPNEAERLLEAAENQRYADLCQHLDDHRREGETEWDYLRRPKKETGFTHQVVSRLTSHTYNPGPHRSTGDDGLDTLIEQVYADNHIDALMHEAERLSTVNRVAAIQVRYTGDRRPEKPINLQLWGADEFVVFESREDPTEAAAVVTIDRYDQTTRYRVWFWDVVHTFVTGKAGDEDGRGTRGGVVAMEVADSPKPNPYGRLPFVFVPYTPQVREFWTPSPGSFLRRNEAEANQQLCELAQAIVKFTVPVTWFKNVPPEFNPEMGRGRFLRLVRGGPAYTGEGFSDTGDPEVGALQFELAIEQVWADVTNTLQQAAEACDLPAGALKLDYSDAPSGVSIVARAFPLLERARHRRAIYQRAETDLVRMIAAVYAARTGDAAIEAAGKTANVLLAWPEPRVPIPGPDRDETDAWEIQLGAKSRIQVIEERYSLTREQAIDHLRRVAEDEATAREILPEPETAPPAEGGPQEGQPGNQQVNDE